MFQSRPLHPRMSAAEPPAERDGAPKAIGLFADREILWVWRLPLWIKKPAGQPYGQTQQLAEKPNGYGNKSFGLPLDSLIGPMDNPMDIRDH
jgi:hypothetical protein